MPTSIYHLLNGRRHIRFRRKHASFLNRLLPETCRFLAVFTHFTTDITTTFSIKASASGSLLEVGRPFCSGLLLVDSAIAFLRYCNRKGIIPLEQLRTVRITSRYSLVRFRKRGVCRFILIDFS